MSNAIMYVMSFSLVVNFGVIFYLLFTGIGKEVYKRYKTKFLHRTGKYINTLMLDKSNNLQEVFAPIVDGTFVFNDLPHVRDPLTTVNYKGIPTNFHIEGDPLPKNPWNYIDRSNIGSEELDTVMNAENTFNFKRWLETNKQMIFIIIVLVVGLLGASVYFGYVNNELLSGLSLSSTELLPQWNHNIEFV